MMIEKDFKGIKEKDMGVNMIDMGNKKIRKMEKDIQSKGIFLFATVEWLNSNIQREIAHMEFLRKKLEKEFKESDLQEFENSQKNLSNLVLKLEWENREGEKFNQKIKILEREREKDFISTLSSKLLGRPVQKQKAKK